MKNHRKKKNKNVVMIGLLALFILAVIIYNAFLPEPSVTEPLDVQEEQQFITAREAMVTYQLAGRDIDDKKVLEVMGKVKRHLFVPADLVNQAYNDNPLPIGYGQTISQPYIVGLMTQHLEVSLQDKVLEIGTGSGYQAAVLAELVDEVYTVEIVKELAESAKTRLHRRGYNNVNVKHADGYYGWEEHAPFDSIIVTAATNHVPPSLLDQLKDGGTLIIPLGSTYQFQTLTLMTKQGEDIKTKFITGVRFVPLTGKALEE